MSARRRLPDRRPTETFVVDHNGHAYEVSIGMFDDGAIAEVFAGGRKIGTEMDALARDAAVLLSISLQFGVPLSTFASALTRNERGEPSSFVGSLIDQIGVTS